MRTTNFDPDLDRLFEIDTTIERPDPHLVHYANELVEADTEDSGSLAPTNRPFPNLHVQKCVGPDSFTLAPPASAPENHILLERERASRTTLARGEIPLNHAA